MFSLTLTGHDFLRWFWVSFLFRFLLSNLKKSTRVTEIKFLWLCFTVRRPIFQMHSHLRLTYNMVKSAALDRFNKCATDDGNFCLMTEIEVSYIIFHSLLYICSWQSTSSVNINEVVQIFLSQEILVVYTCHELRMDLS